LLPAPWIVQVLARRVFTKTRFPLRPLVTRSVGPFYFATGSPPHDLGLLVLFGAIALALPRFLPWVPLGIFLGCFVFFGRVYRDLNLCVMDLFCSTAADVSLRSSVVVPLALSDDSAVVALVFVHSVPRLMAFAAPLTFDSSRLLSESLCIP